jgi:hypothetical protein
MSVCRDCGQSPCKGVNCPSVNNIEGGEIGFISRDVMHENELYDRRIEDGVSVAKYYRK